MSREMMRRASGYRSNPTEPNGRGRKETMDEEIVGPAEAKFNQLLVHEIVLR
jgi:hypothetical protein